MFENTKNVGVKIGLSAAVLLLWASSASANSDAVPVPTLRSLDLVVAIPESSVDLGGPASSSTVLTRPIVEVVPGLVADAEVSGRWAKRRDLASLFEPLGDGRRGRLLEASSLESADLRGVSPTRGIDGPGVIVLGLR